MGINEPAARLRPRTEPSDPAETGVLIVDLAALADNWRTMARLAGGAECGAVVKADAYGLGLAPAMRALLSAGCRTFFVANVVEGEAARAVAHDATIYVLDGLVPGAAPRLVAADLIPALGSLGEIDEWAATGRKPKAAIHFDTGMNRFGIPISEAAQAAERARHIAPTLVMSHFVSSQTRDAPCNARQIEAFLDARARFAEIPASMANSSAVFLPQRPHFDLVRPGYALFGGNPTPYAECPVRPVARLSARILSTREIEPGACVGYDALWSAPKRTRIATIGVGYADGVPVGATSCTDKPTGEALVGGVRCPFIGRVSMDYVVLDVSEAPREAAQRGEWVELLGDGICIEEAASRAGTIGYEILTRLGARFSRRYLGA
ncbi:MAG: alanine racemase [Methylocystis silviterrae]|uniref:alanine racemase n=1 Tax=Methylocystis TaxID=133 RepID=UPI0018C28607|nr:alanine racemase [Methylocystis sp. H4A]MBG0802367.1 alanine racemase [Methylocystis sp. H4A]